jgi:hypothetical protein
MRVSGQQLSKVIFAAETIFDAEREIAFGPHRSVLPVREDAGRTR